MSLILFLSVQAATHALMLSWTRSLWNLGKPCYIQAGDYTTAVLFYTNLESLNILSDN